MVNVLFLHPDLGIGGAERLVLDMGLALKKKGHKVRYVVNHLDYCHCFEEVLDGQVPVEAVGDWIPRSICGRFMALFAYIRFLFLAIYVALYVLRDYKPDVIVCDQIAIVVPIMRMLKQKVLFYCHYPDLLLSAPGGPLKKFYRAPLNWCEEVSTKAATKILVNSRFTANVFGKTFPSIQQRPDVLYPSISTKIFDKTKTVSIQTIFPEVPIGRHLFISINRFERKKNVDLAIRALKKLNGMLNAADFDRVYLAIMGGYDHRVNENVQYLKELKALAQKEGVSDKVAFLQSTPNVIKVSLLRHCLCLIYTPSNEHFGIVPLEAMYSSKPIIAMRSGGPLETVAHGHTGFLCEPFPEQVARHMASFIENPQLSKQMGEEGKKRFSSHFSSDAFAREVDKVITRMAAEKTKR